MSLVLLVEDYSTEVFLRAALPNIVPDCAFDIYSFLGKPDMMKKMEQRLRRYAGCDTYRCAG